jgi:Lsr2
MAQQTIVRYTDDLDGSEASGSVEFALDGRSYEIDLSDENAARLRTAFAPYVAAARRAGGGRGRPVQTAAPRARSGSGRSREEMAQTRTWLREHGYKVSDRGRIPNEYIQAFESKTPASVEGNDHSQDEGSSNGHAVQFQPA